MPIIAIIVSFHDVTDDGVYCILGCNDPSILSRLSNARQRVIQIVGKNSMSEGTNRKSTLKYDATRTE